MVLNQSLGNCCNEIVRTLILNGADVNAVLEKAISENDTKMATLLLKNGAKINSSLTCGCSPLHETSKKGYLEMSKLLIQNGANVCAQHPDSESTPLHWTAVRGYQDINLVFHVLGTFNL